MKNIPSFATFWHGGRLSPYEFACISSFAARGYPTTVYSYHPIAELPDGVASGNAADILPIDWIDQFIVAGKPSMAHFTDYFRLVMFQKTPHIWFDTDVVLLRDFDIDSSGNIIGREKTDSLCNAVMRLKNDPLLEQLIAKVTSYRGLDMKWGTTGPKALSDIYGPGLLTSSFAEKYFYPVYFEDYYKVFLPEYREECETLCTDAYTLHLWNHLVVKTGIFKNIAPPEGSFLHGLFTATGLRGFTDIYPEAAMKTMVYNAVEKIDHRAGIKKVAKLLVPGIRNAIKRRV